MHDDRQTCMLTDMRQTHRKTDRQTCMLTDRHAADRQTDTQTDRQTGNSNQMQSTLILVTQLVKRYVEKSVQKCCCTPEVYISLTALCGFFLVQRCRKRYNIIIQQLLY